MTENEVTVLPEAEGFTVRVNLGVTQNLGDFNSSRIDLSIERRYSVEQGVDETQAVRSAYSFVEELLYEKATEVHAGLTGKARASAKVRPNVE